MTETPDIRIGEATISCDAISTSASSDATITITIGGDGIIQFCVRSHDGFSARVLGPLPALDAAAVEQIATVVEASLDAIRSLAPAPPRVAPAPPPHITEPPTPVSIPTAPPRLTTHRIAPWPTAADRASRERATSTQPFALTLGYQPMLWNGDALVHGLHLGARRLIVSSWLWLGGGLGFTLPFDTIDGAIGARFWAFTINAALGVSVPVAADVVIDLSIGPRLEWLSVSTLADQMAGARAAPASTDLALTSVVAVVPRFAVTSNLSLAFGIGAVFTHNPRAYVFDQGGQFVVLMDQGIPRLHVHVGAQLAL